MNKNTFAARLFTSTSALTLCMCVGIMVLNGCGTAIYPDSKGYSYSSSKASGSKSGAPVSNVGTVLPSSGASPIPASGDSEAEDDEDTDEVDGAIADAGDEEEEEVEEEEAGLDGLALYDAKCAKCHQAKETTTVGNPDVVAVKTAIKDLFIMASVKATDEELAAIQAYLE